jgi:hypothetical protein
MQFHEYPGAIARTQHQILDLNKQIEKISQSLNQVCNDFDLSVAFDPELKNEQQRKAKKAELLRTSGDYEVLSRNLAIAKYNCSRAEIELEQLKGEFTVARLLKREAIAKLEASTEIGV